MIKKNIINILKNSLRVVSVCLYFAVTLYEEILWLENHPQKAHLMLLNIDDTII